jgi:hypothetical protein
MRMVRLSMTGKIMFISLVLFGGILTLALPAHAHMPGGFGMLAGLFAAPGIISFIAKYLLRRTRFLSGVEYSAASLLLLTVVELIIAWTCHFQISSALESHADVKVMSYISGNLAAFWYLFPWRSHCGGVPIILVAFAIGFVPNLMLLRSKGQTLIQSIRDRRKLFQASLFAVIIPAIVGTVFTRPLLFCWPGEAVVSQVPQERLNGALRCAIFDNIPELIPVLIETGADIEGKNSKGQTPVIVASSIRDGHKSMKSLLSIGADVNARDNEGNAPLAYACGLTLSWYESNVESYMAPCEPETVRLLIESGADVNAKFGRNGKTALMIAAKSTFCPESVLKLLLDKGADINVKDKNGLTALSYARGSGVNTLLREKGAVE